MSHCDSNPTHAPPVGTFRTTSNGDAVETPLCLDCLRHRVDSALDHGEHFVINVPGHFQAAALPPYPRHLMSDL